MHTHITLIPISSTDQPPPTMDTRLRSIINSGSIKPATTRIEIKDQTVELGPGDYLDIPAHTKHRVAWTTPDEPTIWLAVHYDGGHS